MSSDLINNEVIWRLRWERLIGSIDAMIQSLVDDDIVISAGVLDPATAHLSDLGLRFEQSITQLQNEGYSKEHKHNVAELLVRLKIFSDTLFHFFHNSFYNSGATPHLTDGNPLYHVLGSIQKSKEFFTHLPFSADEILNILVSQAADDFVRIQSVFNLRFGNEGDEAQRKNLMLASLLMRRSIELFQNSDLNGPYYDEMVTLAYPHNRLEVRLLPYCEALFVGFPVTAYFQVRDERYVDLSNDYILLAHEAGHIAYRFGRLPDEEMSLRHRDRAVSQVLQAKAREQASHFSAEWVEELFCDLYSCFVEGPVFAVGFQMILAGNPPEDFNAPHYPIPALRPFMHTQMLSAMTRRTGSDGNPIFDWPDWVMTVADKLDERWHTLVNQNWHSWLKDEDDQALLNKRYTLSKSEMSGKEILTDVEKLIEILLDEMIGWGFTSESGRWQTVFENAKEAAASSPAEIVEKLYRQYCDVAAQALELSAQTLLQRQKDRESGNAGVTPIEAYASNVVLDELPLIQDAEDLIFHLLESWSDNGPGGGHTGTGYITNLSQGDNN